MSLPRSVLLAACLFSLSSAGWSQLPTPPPPSSSPWISTSSLEATDFHRHAAQFLDDFLRLNPEQATLLGDHRFDGEWTDYSPAGIAKMRNCYLNHSKWLEKLPLQRLRLEDEVDATIWKANLDAFLFGLDELREHHWNPLVYNPGAGLNSLLARDFAPLSRRLDALESRLQRLPRFLAVGQGNLRGCPRIHVETAIKQNRGVIAWLNSELQPYCKKRPGLRDARDKAVVALEAYGRHLETVLLPAAPREFRLGRELFQRKLHFTLESDLTSDEILRRAQIELRKTRAEMVQVARRLHPKLIGEIPAGLSDNELCRAVLTAQAQKRPSNQTILGDARETLRRASEFVKLHKLVSMPTETCQIIEMPEFNRGVSVAYCDSPGPLEKKGETFYAISPTPSDWTAQRSETFYKEYNDAMLEDLTVHEAMPGHFLQLMHANKFKAPTRLRAVFQSGTFVEGWATYAEQLMVAHGYGGDEVHLQQLKMRLRLILNAILDHQVHAGSMTEAEAMKMLMDEGYQEEGEAAGKWRRACLTSAQLSTYFVGNSEVNELCADYRLARPDISEQQLHDDVLHFGSPAPRYIRQLLGLSSARK